MSQARNRPIFVQYGAGNIGRGFIGPLFAKASFRVCYVDLNAEIINALNTRGSYTVSVVSDAGIDEQPVSNVCGISAGDEAAVAEAIAEASLLATAVGVAALPKIAPVLAKGLSLRWKQGNLAPLDILVCENLLHADEFLQNLLRKSLPKEEIPLLENTVGLVETSIGRMVPVMTDAMGQGDPLRVWVEPYAFLPVDKAAFRGVLPDVPGLFPFSPFEFFVQRKLFVHNMGHGLAAYAGFLKNCTYIWEAIGDPSIKLFAFRAMLESARALSRRFAVALEEILPHMDDLLLRFANRALGDTIARVGRDTKRKLAEGDRFAGAAKAAETEGVAPVYLAAGLALALRFTLEGDEGTAYVQEMLHTKGVAAVLQHHCGLAPESAAFQYATEAYALLAEGGTPEDLLFRCEQKMEKVLQSQHVI